jgi:hypothetical protein
MRKTILSTLFVAAMTLSEQAGAFCGFYVAPTDAPLYADATMVALMREGTRTALSMSNNYKGPAADFAMVVPVPVVLQKENVKTLKHEIFKKLEQLSAPRLVEYWEQDPCPPEVDEEQKEARMDKAMAPAAAMKTKGEADYGVKVESQFTVGEYDIVVLSAAESDGLERYLVDNKYNIPKGASAALAPYVKEQMKFFVAKVDIKKVTLDDKGVATLSPLRVTYESQDFRLPVRLGLLNSAGKQDLIVWTLAKKDRYEVANYKNAFIPTNIDVTDETRNAFGPFYAALFDATLEKAGGRAVITEYSWTSSGCDPCPTPPMTDNDVASLGGDVLLGMKTAPGADESDKMGSPGAFYGGTSQPMVLTRLHTRYDATTLTDDLVFKAAEPVVGGREFLTMATPPGTDPKKAQVGLEKSAKPSGYNQFQARYSIRHAWTGPIACANPRRGVWGGPPGGHGAKPGPVPAVNLAAAPRTGVQLATYVKSPIEELELKKDAPPAASAPDGSLPGQGPASIHRGRLRHDSAPYGYFMLGFVGAGIALLAIGMMTRKQA